MKQKTILAIDTSETACSVALWHQQQLSELIEPLARKHSDCLLPMIDSVLAAQHVALSQLDGIAFAGGPGAFTGLRLGAALVQGFRFALTIPVIRVSTLLAQAYAGFRQYKIPLVLSALDARMGEIYVATYEFFDNETTANRFQTLLPEQVFAPAQLSKKWLVQQDWIAVGSGCVAADAFALNSKPVTLDINIHCNAAHVMACVLDFNLPSDAQHEATLPIYLRNKVVN